MARDRGRFTDEFRDSVAREVVEMSHTIVDVAKKNGVSENSVSRWVKAYRRRYPEITGEPVEISERQRLRELEKEVRELREENEILGKATAFFAKKHR
ncbi:transposase [Gordonia sp. L191]|uniref:transposase n=1 Tax=Gordonia sp. L191 TaxID=2982699 RepID=UPI0024C03C15|nr:transposase [Gordonia sp. L191]WHU48609.1 transposase [Gordonia sp. L191]WHU49331.1 transposase [Gordonia sp. L191]WHU49345.1 transposase [Gordonia sp. L191]